LRVVGPVPALLLLLLLPPLHVVELVVGRHLFA
jgi:hypothetical protein